MKYKKFQNLQLSALGLGMMRLPVLNGSDAQIDEKATADMIAYAREKGINYFDTAWGYHNGESELVAGRILSQYPRESYYLASKFPGYDLGNMDKVEEIFEKQLKKCQTEYFDFYLFHNVNESNIDAYLDQKFGIYEYLMKQKVNGRIKHLGFSAHGDYAVMKRFLDAYGESMEFCQLQINYLDWSFQHAKEKVELVQKYQIPVWVMEPLRGGKLATLSDERMQRLQALRPNETAPGMAFRFLQSIPEVTMILSGMSNAEQLSQNIRTFEKDAPLTEEENAVVMQVAQDILAEKTVPCTSCHYCVSKCPMELDIPLLLSLYNEHSVTGGGFMAPMTLGSMPENKRPQACLSCRSCEAVCPQQIKISETLAAFVQIL